MDSLVGSIDGKSEGISEGTSDGTSEGTSLSAAKARLKTRAETTNKKDRWRIMLLKYWGWKNNELLLEGEVTEWLTWGALYLTVLCVTSILHGLIVRHIKLQLLYFKTTVFCS